MSVIEFKPKKVETKNTDTQEEGVFKQPVFSLTIFNDGSTDTSWSTKEEDWVLHHVIIALNAMVSQRYAANV